MKITKKQYQWQQNNKIIDVFSIKKFTIQNIK
jgi:hypothetical protein